MDALDRKAVIIVDHGSRVQEANDLLDRVVRDVRDRCGDRFVAVEAAHMELAQPSIAHAFGRCVEAGAEQVVVVQFFLSPGRHAAEDIPRLVAEAAQSHANVSWSVTEPIGSDPALVDILLARADGAG